MKGLGMVSVLVLLAGCAGSPNNEGIGAVSGAVIGGILGNQIGSGGGRALATAGGVLLGAHIGANIGHQYDLETKRHIYESLDEVPLAHSRSWSSADEVRYTLTPVRTYRQQEQVCRAFKMTILRGDEVERVNGRACRERVGHWEIIES
jgi:surface antigen